MQLVFAPNSAELAATTQLLVQGALQQWLGNLIALQAVDVEAVDSTLTRDRPLHDPAHGRGRDGKLRTGRVAAMIYHCCDELRRNAVAAHPTLNGIDYLEVLDNEAPAGSPRQRTLFLRLLKPVPASFTAEQRPHRRRRAGARHPCGMGGAGLEPAARGDPGRAGLFRGLAGARPCAGRSARIAMATTRPTCCASCARRSTPRRPRASIPGCRR